MVADLKLNIKKPKMLPAIITDIRDANILLQKTKKIKKATAEIKEVLPARPSMPSCKFTAFCIKRNAIAAIKMPKIGISKNWYFI